MLRLMIKGGMPARNINPSASSHSVGIKIGSLNIRSIGKKSASVHDLLQSLRLDVLALQETWHENVDSLSLRRAVPEGYAYIEAARQRSITELDAAKDRTLSGGGVAVIYRNNYRMKKLPALPIVQTFEYAGCRLSLSCKSDVIVMSIYRPGSKKVAPLFFSDFTILLESLVTYRCPVVLLGDINIHFERYADPHATEFFTILQSFDFLQHVTELTHKDGGLLDVVITRGFESVNDIVLSETGMSDHLLITCRLPSNTESDNFVPTEGRKWNQFCIDDFRTELSNSVLCDYDNETINALSIYDLFAAYNNTLVALLDRHAPRYIRKRKRRVMSPWFDEECRASKRDVRRMECKYRKTRLSTDRQIWVKKLREQVSFYRKKEHDYWSARIVSNSADPKQLWRDLDDLMKRSDEDPVTSAEEAKLKADNFSDFFTTKVENIYAETADGGNPVNEQYTDKQFKIFTPTSSVEIARLIARASNKCCSLDPAPTAIVKNCSDLLSPYIEMLFNRSLSESHIPADQKLAYVTPHLKKRGLDCTDNSNFRPVSNLSFISKLLEKIVATQLTGYLESNHLLPTAQSAYRRFHSTETALLKVFSDLSKAVDDGNVCLLGLLDLSAAFDTVDHEILLSRLELSYGITGSPLTWLNSYLFDRTQIVRVAGCNSSSTKLLHGVPQGSLLGPLLFITYSAPIADIIKRHGLWNHCYADDTQIFFYCRPDQMACLSAKVSACIAELQSWMAANRLKLNANKTEFVWIASRTMLKQIATNIPPTIINDSSIPRSTVARNLGVYFDDQLNMRQHIANITRLSYFQLRQLRVVSRSLTKDALKMLLHSFVFSRLDYCNSLFYGLPDSSISKLQSVQNAAARLFGGLRKFDHVTPILRDQLHWLPIRQRINFKIATLVYKSLNHLAPEYLLDMLHLASDDPALCRNRSAANGQLIPEEWNTVNFGKRNFYHSAPYVWNSIPVEIRQQRSLTVFKSKLKTFLFQKAYLSN